MAIGHIREIHSTKSYGYIELPDEDESVYFHLNDANISDPNLDKQVVFDLKTTKWGQRAYSVEEP